MHLKFPQSSSALSVFAVILIALVCDVAMAQGQATTVEPSAQTQAISTDVDPAPNSASRKTAELGAKASTPATKSNDKADNPASDYKKTVTDLVTLYEREVQKLEQQNNQAKRLYRDGLIARVDMEKSDKDLADARAKVEEARNQIAATDKLGQFVPAVSTDFTAINARWSTGNNRVDTLVRYYGKTYGVDPYLIYCLMSQESKFSTIAISHKDAHGLMQLMPGTAARYGGTNP